MKKIIFILFFFILLNGAISAEVSDKIDIHGFISQGYIKSSDNNYLADTKDGTFQFNEMAINFGKWLTPELHIGMQLFARDLGNLGNDKIVVDWVSADYYFKKWLMFSVGKIKIPFGFYNETRDMDIIRTSIFLPQGIYNEGWRDSVSGIKGCGLQGTVPVSFMGTFIYQAQTGAMTIENEGGIAKFVDSQYDVSTTGFDIDPLYNVSLQWETPINGLKIGSTYTLFEYIQYLYSQSFSTNAEMPIDHSYLVLSAEFLWNEFKFSAEYGRDTIDYSLFETASGFVIEDKAFDMEGYYGSVSYRLLHWLEVGFYYSVFYVNSAYKDGSQYDNGLNALGWQKDSCLSTLFEINSNWLIKIEGHYIDGLAVLYYKDQEINPDGGRDIDDKWYLFAAKVSYSF